jgi:hypothetical protein
MALSRVPRFDRDQIQACEESQVSGCERRRLRLRQTNDQGHRL